LAASPSFTMHNVFESLTVALPHVNPDLPQPVCG